MDRIINVKVGGNHLSKDNKNAGVRGEANVTMLRITFDEGWDGYAKTVTFFDAYGNNPVKRIETVDLLEDIVNDTRTYITPIPKEPLAIAGEMTFVIDGYLDGKRQRSIADKLVVKDAPITDNATEPTDPIPEPYEQLQEQIDSILPNIQTAQAGAETARDEAVIARDEAIVNAEDARGAAEQAGNSKAYASIYANEAAASAEKAETAIKHEPTIIDGYWHTWDATNKQYVDTGVRAQAGSTVHYGDNPPDDADVWIDPEGESAYLEIKNYIDEQTEIIKSDVEGLQAQINEEAHFRGYVSTNAKIQALEATPNDFAYSAESGTKWVYEVENGWVDTGKPVPDQLTPASDTTPLINGVASVGSENAYARGDHRHPTDTTREDKANKVYTFDPWDYGGYESPEANEQYPTVKAVIDAIARDGSHRELYAIEQANIYTNEKLGEIKESLEGEIDVCGDFEPVYISKDDSGNPSNKDILKEKVGIIQHTFDNQYKELYIRFTIPPSEEASAGTASTDKARWQILTLNDGGTNTNKLIYEMGNQFVTDYTSEWYTSIHIKVFGYGDKAYSRTELWHDLNANANKSYAKAPNNSTFSGFVSPSTPMNRDYIDRLKIQFATAGNVADGSVRYLPVDTKFELWGVRK